MSPLRAAVLGFGVGEAHADTYAAHPGCELVAVCDLSTDRRERAIRRFPGIRVTGDADEVLDDPSIDLISIATYDDAHFSQTLQALGRGKHVFVEKPLCRSLDELREMRRQWSHARTGLASNLVLREAPLYSWLHKARVRGDLGRVFAFDGDYLYGRLEKITQGWRKDVDRYSVMQGGGIHLVDLMLSITGERPVSVMALGGRIATAGSAFRYDDLVAASYRFTSGCVGRITANFGCVHPHQHVVRVFGTSATFLYDDRGPRLCTSRDPHSPGRSLDLKAEPDAKGALLSTFINAILAGTHSEAEVQREFDLLSVCLAADHALRAGSEVRVVYV